MDASGVTLMRKDATKVEIELINIDVLDDNRELVKRIEIDAREREWRMTIRLDEGDRHGARYEHVSDAPDGAWQFAPMK
jgi:hypothetical protein